MCIRPSAVIPQPRAPKAFPANDNDRQPRTRPQIRRAAARGADMSAGASAGSVRNRLMLALLIWGGILPPFAGELSDYMEDEMLGLMMRSALRATLPGRIA